MNLAIVIVVAEAILLMATYQNYADKKEECMKMKEEHKRNVDRLTRDRDFYCQLYDGASNRNKRLNEDVNYLKMTIGKYQEENFKLRAELKNGGPKGGIAFKSETAKELVKFAMAQAHPDKPNGSNERFVKYREIYEKVCK